MSRHNLTPAVLVLLASCVAVVSCMPVRAQTVCTQVCIAQDRNGNCIEWRTVCTTPREPVCREVCVWLDPQKGCTQTRMVCQ